MLPGGMATSWQRAGPTIWGKVGPEYRIRENARADREGAPVSRPSDLLLFLLTPTYTLFPSLIITSTCAGPTSLRRRMSGREAP